MRAKRVDSNLTEIVTAARKLGLRVNVTNDTLTDLTVQLGGGVTELWEVKGKNGRLTPRQKKLRGDGWCIRLIVSVDDVIAAAKTMRSDLEAIRKARVLL